MDSGGVERIDRAGSLRGGSDSGVLVRQGREANQMRIAREEYLRARAGHHSYMG